MKRIFEGIAIRPSGIPVGQSRDSVRHLIAFHGEFELLHERADAWARDETFRHDSMDDFILPEAGPRPGQITWNAFLSDWIQTFYRLEELATQPFIDGPVRAIRVAIRDMERLLDALDFEADRDVHADLCRQLAGMSTLLAMWIKNLISPRAMKLAQFIKAATRFWMKRKHRQVCPILSAHGTAISRVACCLKGAHNKLLALRPTTDFLCVIRI